MSKSSRGEGSGRQKERTTAEWVTLGASILIILGLIGFITYEFFFSSTRPPLIEVNPRIEEVRQEGEAYYLPVEVSNRGDTIAEDIEVELTLTPEEGEPEAAQISLSFLSGGESADMITVFKSDPTTGRLEHVIAFGVP
jgi:uncharacterized protein (TIGR02588 family)